MTNSLDAIIRLLETAVAPETEFDKRRPLAERALCALKHYRGSMTLRAYQDSAAKTAHYPAQRGIEYTTLGLAGEAGEVANKVKKMLRGDYGREELRAQLCGEIGDCLWYLVMLARELDLDIDAIAQANLNKLADREKRGMIVGSGDNR